jgi:nucleotidyltransferase/DNA polymerase involved in DNA repair
MCGRYTLSTNPKLVAKVFAVPEIPDRRRGLVGRPVGVLGNQGACVIAKSYEMKAAGVKTGAPVWEARVLCPDGLYVKRDFR